MAVCYGLVLKFCLEATLDTLRARQKLQVEELKRATAFYSTKELVDRFDTPSRGSPSVLEVCAISLLLVVSYLDVIVRDKVPRKGYAW